MIAAASVYTHVSSIYANMCVWEKNEARIFKRKSVCVYLLFCVQIKPKINAHFEQYGKEVLLSIYGVEGKAYHHRLFFTNIFFGVYVNTQHICLNARNISQKKTSKSVLWKIHIEEQREPLQKTSKMNAAQTSSLVYALSIRGYYFYN